MLTLLVPPTLTPRSNALYLTCLSLANQDALDLPLETSVPKPTARRRRLS